MESYSSLSISRPRYERAVRLGAGSGPYADGACSVRRMNQAQLVISDHMFRRLSEVDDAEHNEIVDSLEAMASGFGLGTPVRVCSTSGREMLLERR